MMTTMTTIMKPSLPQLCRAELGYYYQAVVLKVMRMIFCMESGENDFDSIIFMDCDVKLKYSEAAKIIENV